jgi:hypothetical protein
MWEKRIILWYVADSSHPWLKTGHITAVDIDSSGRYALQAAQTFEENGLSGTGWAQQDEILAFGHFQAELF